MKTDKQKAKELLASFYSDKFLFADSETTGFSKKSEIIEFALTDHEGNVLLDTLVKPVGPIPAEVSEIHGITAETVKDAPSWSLVGRQILEVMDDKTIVFYNKSFDLRMLKQSFELHGLLDIQLEEKLEQQTVCAMKPYAMFNGQMNKSGRGYKSVKLGVAAEQEGVVMTDQTGSAHRSLYDSLMVQRMCRNLASEAEVSDEVSVF